jgi:predicted anti-sigma-YlaC factor YlaD
VGCGQYREALSADLDGEPLGTSAVAVQAHLGSCAGCQAWYEAAGRLSRLARLAPAMPMPDLAPEVLGAVGPLRPPRRLAAGAARSALAAVAFVQALLAWSGALTGQDSMVSGHVAHEVGAWNLALAVAFLAAASRPRTAGALVAPVGVFVAVLAVSAVSDAVAGSVDGGRLAAHLLVAAGLALLIVVSRLPVPEPGLPPVRTRGGRPEPSGPEWRVAEAPGEVADPDGRSASARAGSAA